MYLKNGNKILITADRACDIPKVFVEQYGIKFLDYYIVNQYEEYCDTKEISGKSLLEYIKNNDDEVKVRVSDEGECEEFFKPLLVNYDQIVHICIGDSYSESYVNVKKVSASYQNLYVVNSKTLSIGAGMVVCYAAKIVPTCETVQELIERINKYSSKVVLNIMISRHSKFKFNNIKKYKLFTHNKLGQNARIILHYSLRDDQKYLFMHRIFIKNVYIRKMVKNIRKNPRNAFYLSTSTPNDLGNRCIKQLKDCNVFNTFYEAKPSSSTCLYFDENTVCIAYEVNNWGN